MSLEPRGVYPLNKGRFPLVGDHIHTTPTSEHSWATPRHAVIGASNLRSSIDSERFTDIQTVIFKEFFHLSTSRS